MSNLTLPDKFSIPYPSLAEGHREFRQPHSHILNDGENCVLYKIRNVNEIIAEEKATRFLNVEKETKFNQDLVLMNNSINAKNKDKFRSLLKY